MKKSLTLSEVRIFRVKVGEGEKLRAFSSIVLNDSICLYGLRIYEGSKGLFVSFPSHRDKDGNYVSIYRPINKESNALIQNTILDEYGKSLNEVA